MSSPGNLWRKVHGRITKRPTNFSWIIDGMLAGSGRPTSREEFDWIESQGVKCIVTMTEDALPPFWIADSDTAEYLHLPTPDLTAPTQDELDRAADFIREQTEKHHRPVVVHCAAGLGRAGTVLACYLVKHKGYGAQDAIDEIRTKRPGSIQSAEQETAVEFFERHVRGG